MIRETRLRVASNPARGWQANRERTCAWLVVLGLCPKMKNHPLCGWMFIRADIYCVGIVTVDFLASMQYSWIISPDPNNNKIVVSENKNSNPRKGESNMDYIIETENLTKRYGTATVVDKVNLHVPKGKIYGLLGRNGAGKTTAMKMMLQLAFPTEGTVRLFGTNYKENIHTLYSKVGSIIETPGFYSNLTGYENLQILAKLRGGVSKSGVEKALEVVGLHKEKRKVFSDYSLGMKQRLGIAAAIMHEPELLILDEPINGLDPIGIVEIRSFLSELSHNHGITIFISSHVLSEIEQIADIIGVMHEGHLVEEVNISELHKRNRKYIQFDLSDSEIAGKILENHYHMTDFTVQDGTVRIYDFSQSVGEINREFARNGLLVTRINDSEENLEDYFSKLIGGGGIA